VTCGATGVKSFFYRCISLLTGKFAQVNIGNFPQTSLAAARLKLNELKLLRRMEDALRLNSSKKSTCEQSKLNRLKYLN